MMIHKSLLAVTSVSSAIIWTAFSDSSLYPAKIHHFALHFCSVKQSHINHGFAVDSWPLEHPQKNAFGKPYEVWCSSVFSDRDELVPLEYVHCPLLTMQYVIHDETVLVTVPV